jgi:hypothetical protein
MTGLGWTTVVVAAVAGLRTLAWTRWRGICDQVFFFVQRGFVLPRARGSRACAVVWLAVSAVQDPSSPRLMSCPPHALLFRQHVWVQWLYDAQKWVALPPVAATFCDPIPSSQVSNMRRRPFCGTTCTFTLLPLAGGSHRLTVRPCLVSPHVVPSLSRATAAAVAVRWGSHGLENSRSAPASPGHPYKRLQRFVSLLAPRSSLVTRVVQCAS